jgi:hypothetical protein
MKSQMCLSFNYTQVVLVKKERERSFLLLRQIKTFLAINDRKNPWKYQRRRDALSSKEKEKVWRGKISISSQIKQRRW